MSQNDFVIDNGTGLAVRQDIESAFQALASNNSGSSTPSTTYAYQFWADSSAGTLKIRNSANNAWIELLQLDGTLTLEDGSASAPALGFRDDLDTGIFSGGANEFNIATGGSERLAIDSSGNLLHGVTSSEDTTGNSGTKLITTGDLQIDGDQKALVFRSTASTAQKMSGIQWWNETGAGVQCAIFGVREAVTLAPGALAFYTSPNVDTSANNGEGDITERMRIDSNGNVAIGTSATTMDGNGLKIYHTNTPSLQLQNNATGTGATAGAEIILDSGGVLSIVQRSGESIIFKTANTLAAEFKSNQRIQFPEVYSTAGSSMRDVQIESDGTLCGLSSITAAKTNITDLTDVSWLYNLKPKTFNFRKKTVHAVTGVNTYLDEAEDEKAHGFLAEDVEAINKDFCFYNKDSEGNDVLAGVYYKTMIVPLVKAVQELKAENSALATRVAALEAA